MILDGMDQTDLHVIAISLQIFYRTPMLWFSLRIVVILANIVAVATYPRDKTNLDWLAALIISSLFSLILFGWLVMIRRLRALDWSDAYSLTKAFFPMNRHPLRFWHLAALSWSLAGAIGILLDGLLNRSTAFSGVFLFTGLGIGLAVFFAEKTKSATQG